MNTILVASHFLFDITFIIVDPLHIGHFYSSALGTWGCVLSGIAIERLIPDFPSAISHRPGRKPLPRIVSHGRQVALPLPQHKLDKLDQLVTDYSISATITPGCIRGLAKALLSFGDQVLNIVPSEGELTDWLAHRYGEGKFARISAKTAKNYSVAFSYWRTVLRDL